MQTIKAGRATSRPRTAVSASDEPDRAVHPIRVLLVEDELITAMQAEALLDELGYEVCDIAPSAPKAVRAAERHRPDLVVMDINLAQNTDGIEAARAIRQRLGIMSLFVTAYSDPATRQRASGFKHFGFVAKPYGRVDLAQALNHAVERLHRGDN